MKFTELNLTDELKSGLKDINFLDTTPIQEKAIPDILEGKDIIGTAQTGTGKTGAFVIPIMDRILRGGRDGIKAIILTPTRELAQQIDEQIFAIGYHTGITSATVIGGSDFSTQAKALKAGVDIIIATPGRFIDQNRIVNIDFSTVEYLVLDEADRMLDMGFLPDMKKIISWVPEKRQTLLFSATMPKEIERLASSIMKNPVSVEIARAAPPQLVEQRAYYLKSDQKIPLVKQVFDTIRWESCIIFTSTKKGTDELQRLLKKQGIKAGSIHGDRSQDERNKALNAFKNRQIPVIVATNVLARGIDIKDVSMIINYDVPRSADDYVHRIGRTGRYDKSGIAVTLVTKRDRSAFAEIERIKSNKIKTINLPGSFDESSKFSWDGEEAPESGKSGKQTPSDNSAGKKRGGAPKKDDSGKRTKSGNGQQNKTGERDKRKSVPKSSNGKKSKSKETAKSGPSARRSGHVEKGSGSEVPSKREKESQQVNEPSRPEKSHSKTSSRSASGKNGMPGKSSSDETGQSRRTSFRYGSGQGGTVATVSRVDKASERITYSRQPAKGFWGIVKSLIPRFKRNH